MKEDQHEEEQIEEVSMAGTEEGSIREDRWNWLSGGGAWNNSSVDSDDTKTVRYECNLSYLPSSAKQWRTIQQEESGPRGRCSHSMTPINDHTLLLFAGGYSNKQASDDDDDDVDVDDSNDFEHLDDLWLLSALTAKWTRLQPCLKDKPCQYSDETADSYWGMRFGPPRRGHMVAYYHYQYKSTRNTPPPHHHSSGSVRKGRLIVFGGITNIESETDGAMSSARNYLNDVWIFDLPSLQWRRIHPSAAKCRPPGPRRDGISWVDGDFFYVFGGDIIGGAASEHDAFPAGGASGNNDNRSNRPVISIYRLGPLSSPFIQWTWSIQPSYNSSFLYKRAPNCPIVTLGPRSFGSLSHTAHAIVDRKLWVFGGLDMSFVEPHLSVSNFLYRLDLDTYQWVIIHAPKKAPCPRYCHDMASWGRFLIVAGGIGFFGEDDVAANFAREPSTNTADAFSDDEDAGNVREANPDPEGPDEDNEDDTSRELTVFDLYLFDTEAMKWKQEHPSNVAGVWPCARNAFTMTRLGSNTIVLFGGGVYPSAYYSDTFALAFDLPIEVPKPKSKRSARADVCSDLGDLYRTGMLSDVTLVVGKEQGTPTTFAAHKAILAARSDFFKTMFEGPYSEASANEIHLPDVDPDAVDVVLHFLYTGMVDSHALMQDDDDRNPGIVSSALMLSDLWDISKLLEALEDALALAMRKGHTDPIELLSFAKAHNCRRLVSMGLEFAKRKWNTLRDSPSARAADPEILEEIEDFVHSLL